MLATVDKQCLQLYHAPAALWPPAKAQLCAVIQHSTPSHCPACLQCVGALSQALGSLWRPYAQQLLEAMILTGLSDTLVASLQDVAAALPELLEDIQAQLLDLLSLVLARRPFNPSTSQAK